MSHRGCPAWVALFGRGRGPWLVLARTDLLRCHERIRPGRFVEVRKEVLDARAFRRPIVVDVNTHVILDGHHRYATARSLGLAYIPALLVDYRDEEIKVRSWRHVEVTKRDVVRAGLSGRPLPPKTSRHIFPFDQERVNVPLSDLGWESMKILLDPEEMPKYWYNILAEVGDELPPYLDPDTKQPVPREAFEALFPKECVRQEFSRDRYIPIPEELREHYLRVGRPTPLYRARRLEERLRTPARIYYKREDLSPTGSHKVNTALAQAYYAAREGLEVLTTETGAGQWGSALSYACAMMGMRAMVFMVRVSYQQKPYRKYVMMLYGARVVPSPSDLTEVGRRFLEKDPNHPGSLGIAISEAIEYAVKHDEAKYSLGSVLNHVLLHQTIIGQEVMLQLEEAGEKPDVMIGCVGGGSNFAGFIYPFVGKVLRGETKGIRFVAVEPKACPSMTEGEYRYDYGDTARMTPLIRMYTLGHEFVPPPIHAGGLRYHGAAPTLSLLVNKGVVESVAYTQEEVFEAARLFAETEGLIPAPETAHAVKAAIDEAIRAREEGEERVIVFNYSGHGLLDLEGYRQVLKLG